MNGDNEISVQPIYEAFATVIDQLEAVDNPEAARLAAVLRALQQAVRWMCPPPPPHAVPTFVAWPPNHPGHPGHQGN